MRYGYLNVTDIQLRAEKGEGAASGQWHEGEKIERGY